VVALVDGEPVTWREVAASAMRLNARQLVDQYIYLKLRRAFIRKHGITNDAGEVRARAEAILESAKRTQGEERVKADLAEQGVTEEQYVQRFATDPAFAERLLAETAIVYTMMTEPTVEVDIVAFTDERDGQEAADDLARGRDFDEAIAGLQGRTRGRVIRWPRRRIARGFVPSSLAHLEEALFRMKEGEATGLERTAQNVVLVARVVKQHPASAGTYESLKQAVMDEILRSPPGDEQVNVWSRRLFRGSKIQYEDRNSARD
jgi:hypothetical protein